MENSQRRGELEYGWSSNSRGTTFASRTHCQYFELLRYAGPDGAEILESNGELKDYSIEQWLFKVPSFPSSLYPFLLIDLGYDQAGGCYFGHGTINFHGWSQATVSTVHALR